jgi:hypothetical protein
MLNILDEKSMMGLYQGGISGVSFFIIVSIYDYVQNLKEKNKILEEKNKYSMDENEYLKYEINKHMCIIGELREELAKIRKRKARDKIIIEYEDSS